MARDISELGADVFDDTIPLDQKRFSKKKRNFIVGFSLLGVGLLGLVTAGVVLGNTIFKDYETIPYLEFYYNEPDPVTGEVTATLSKLRKEGHGDYPANFRIPSQINGHKVVKIDTGAFNDCDRLQRVVMTDNIREIGALAFRGCTELESFRFSKSLSYIGSRAFEGTKFEETALSDPNSIFVLNDQFIVHVGKNFFSNDVVLLNDESSVIPAGLEGKEVVYFSNLVKKKVTGFMDGCFEDNQSLLYVEIPSSLINLPDECFYNCQNLIGVDLSSTEINSLSSSAFANCSKLSNLKLADGKITSIGDYCFEGTKIEAFPAGLEHLKEVGKGIFKNCVELESFVYPAELSIIPNETFQGCTSLTSFSYSNDDSSNIKSIGSHAFEGTKLTSFEVPANTTFLADYLFKDCKELTKVTLLDNTFEGVNALIPNTDEDGNYIVLGDVDEGFILDYQNNDDLKYFVEGEYPEPYMIEMDEGVYELDIDEFGNPVYASEGTLVGVGFMYNSTFEGCSKLDTISLFDFDGNPVSGKSSDGVINLPSTLITTSSAGSDGKTGSTFVGTTVSDVTFNKHVRTISNNMFDGVSSLTSVNFEEGSDSLVEIGDYAFRGTSISEITIPDSLNKMGVGVFQNCSSLTTVNLPEKPTDKLGLAILDNTFNNDSNLKAINFPTQLTKVGKRAFENTGLTSVTFKDRLGTIDNYAFARCNSLTSVTIVSGVKEIGEGAFSNCSNLSSFELPEGNKTIYSKAFENTALVSIVIPASTTKIYSDTFSGCSKLETIYLKATSVPSGFQDGWNNGATVLTYSETSAPNAWHYVAGVPTAW